MYESLCKNCNRVIAEYALREMNKPVGVSSYRVRESLPEDLQESLPTVEQLEEQLGRLEDDVKTIRDE